MLALIIFLYLLKLSIYPDQVCEVTFLISSDSEIVEFHLFLYQEISRISRTLKRLSKIIASFIFSINKFLNKGVKFAKV